jgi:hypothetical protein
MGSFSRREPRQRLALLQTRWIFITMLDLAVADFPCGLLGKKRETLTRRPQRSRR